MYVRRMSGSHSKYTRGILTYTHAHLCFETAYWNRRISGSALQNKLEEFQRSHLAMENSGGGGGGGGGGEVADASTQQNNNNNNIDTSILDGLSNDNNTRSNANINASVNPNALLNNNLNNTPNNISSDVGGARARVVNEEQHPGIAECNA